MAFRIASGILGIKSLARATTIIHSFSYDFLKTGAKAITISNRSFSKDCNCNKNQTPLDSLKLLQTKQNPNMKGTGLFLVPAPEKGILETKVVVVKDLSYQEVEKRGFNCEAFKWIAEAHRTIEQIEAERAQCPQIWCGRSEVICPPGCFCSYLFCR